MRPETYNLISFVRSLLNKYYWMIQRATQKTGKLLAVIVLWITNGNAIYIAIKINNISYKCDIYIQ